MIPEYQIHTKEVQKIVYDAVIRDVEVPHMVTHEIVTEVPQVQIVHLTKEIPTITHQIVAGMQQIRTPMMAQTREFVTGGQQQYVVEGQQQYVVGGQQQQFVVGGQQQ